MNRPKYDTKVCSRCDIEKPVEDYTWYRRKLADQTWGFYAMGKCKLCHAEHRRELYHKDPDKRALIDQLNAAWTARNQDRVREIAREGYHRRKAR